MQTLKRNREITTQNSLVNYLTHMFYEKKRWDNKPIRSGSNEPLTIEPLTSHLFLSYKLGELVGILDKSTLCALLAHDFCEGIFGDLSVGSVNAVKKDFIETLSQKIIEKYPNIKNINGILVDYTRSGKSFEELCSGFGIKDNQDQLKEILINFGVLEESTMKLNDVIAIAKKTQDQIGENHIVDIILNSIDKGIKGSKCSADIDSFLNGLRLFEEPIVKFVEKAESTLTFLSGNRSQYLDVILKRNNYSQQVDYCFFNFKRIQKHNINEECYVKMLKLQVFMALRLNEEIDAGSEEEKCSRLNTKLREIFDAASVVLGQEKMERITSDKDFSLIEKFMGTKEKTSFIDTKNLFKGYLASFIPRDLPVITDHNSEVEKPLFERIASLIVRERDITKVGSPDSDYHEVSTQPSLNLYSSTMMEPCERASSNLMEYFSSSVPLSELPSKKRDFGFSFRDVLRIKVEELQKQRLIFNKINKELKKIEELKNEESKESKEDDKNFVHRNFVESKKERKEDGNSSIVDIMK